MQEEGGAQTVHVIGAGVVGVCTALYLQREGFEVTVFDPASPGSGCSTGNAGNIGIASFIPMATPGIWRSAWRMWADPLHPLDIRLTHLPRAAPWFWSFARSSSEKRFQEISDALASIMQFAFDAYAPLLREAKCEEMIQRRGRLSVYETGAAFERARKNHDLRRERGIEVLELTGDEVRELEPCLGPTVQRGCFMPEGGHSINPHRMVTELARSFAQNGGRILRDAVKGFDIDGDGLHGIVTEAGRTKVERVVLAAGVDSAPLARQLGTSVPIEAERGYHVMIPHGATGMRIPAASSERNVVITPMEHGVRLSTGSEFSGRDAPPRWDLCLRILEGARELVPALTSSISSRWFGDRPATPDGLPVIGRSPVHHNAYFAFGHGHVGLGTAAITGRILSRLIAGKPTEVDVAPFRPERFRGRLRTNQSGA